MRINIMVNLLAPSMLQFIGRENHPVFRKELEIELTAQILNTLIDGFVEIEPGLVGRVCIRSVLGNTFSVVTDADMLSSDAAYFNGLIARGWQLDPETARAHNLPNDRVPPQKQKAAPVQPPTFEPDLTFPAHLKATSAG